MERITKHSFFRQLVFILIFVVLSTAACNYVTTQTTVESQTAVLQTATQPPTNTPPKKPIARISPVSTIDIVALSPVATPPPTPVIAATEATARVSVGITLDSINQLQPNPDSALVTGRLIDIATGTPAPYVYVYLSEVIGPDAKPLVVLDRGNASLSISNEYGIFFFENVTPGKYSIIVWSPVGSFLIKDPETEYSLLFEVEFDELKNLGDLTSIIP